MENIIELDNVTKRFGGITALNKASLKVTRGEVVGLIGDNGAGKSTLIKTLVGVYSPDEGDILIRGKKVNAWNALKARESGIETVFQDRALTPQQSIVKNIFMGKELRYPFGFIKEKEQIFLVFFGRVSSQSILSSMFQKRKGLDINLEWWTRTSWGVDRQSRQELQKVPEVYPKSAQGNGQFDGQSVEDNQAQILLCA